MIFVCLGSQPHQFNRLLMKLDQLLEEKKIDGPVFAQIGSSTYYPKNYQYATFLEPHIFEDYLKNKAKLVITHGGTGTIVKALKADKHVIAVPRREKYGEHVDDHQLQIVDNFADNEFIKKVENMEDLYSCIISTYIDPARRKFSSEGNIVEIIENFISENKQ